MHSLQPRVASANQPLGDIQVAVAIGGQTVRTVESARGQQWRTDQIARLVFRVRPARAIECRFVSPQIADQPILAIEQRRPGRSSATTSVSLSSWAKALGLLRKSWPNLRLKTPSES